MSSRYWTKYEYRWSLIFTLVFMLWAVIEVELGWHEMSAFKSHLYFTYLFLIPAFLCYYLFFYDKKTHRFKKRFKFEHAFKSGLVLSFLIAAINIPVQLVIHTLVSPSYLTSLKMYLVKEKLVSSENVNFINLGNSLWFYPLILFILGVLLTLIYASTIRQGEHKYSRGYKK